MMFVLMILPCMMPHVYMYVFDATLVDQAISQPSDDCARRGKMSTTTHVTNITYHIQGGRDIIDQPPNG